MRGLRMHTFVFLIGTTGYGLLELMYRGRTHWTMLLLGGTSFWIIYLIRKNMQPVGRLSRCLTGCIAITVLELLVGSICNCRMGLCVWDYSGLPYNVCGQICPAFTLLWFLLCFPADAICGYLSCSRNSHGFRWQ